MSRLTKIERALLQQEQQQNDSLFEREKKKRVQLVFNKMVTRINQEIDLDKFKKTYFPDEDRTLEFLIEGMEDLDTGFVFEGGRVRTIERLKDEPTVRFKCTEDVFLQLATQEISFASAFLYGWLDITGENYMRDYEIFKRMFNKYGHILKE